MKSLVIYVGEYDPDEPGGRSHAQCCANTKFWDPLVNGETFPDLKNLEVRHLWAAEPPKTASVDLTRFISSLAHRWVRNPPPDLISQASGLAKLESICLEGPPELDARTFMQMVGNPKVKANNLTDLDLRYCALPFDIVKELLLNAPKSLKRLSLMLNHHDRGENVLAFRPKPAVHLCPLIREFSKRLERLDFAAPYICSQMFYAEDEMQALDRSSLMPAGNANGELDSGVELDAAVIEEIITDSRKKSRQAHREQRFEEALAVARKNNRVVTEAGILLTGPPLTPAQKMRVRTETQLSLDQEEEARQREIEKIDRTWLRRIIMLRGCCSLPEAPGAESWPGLQMAAEQEEEGVEWVLASKY